MELTDLETHSRKSNEGLTNSKSRTNKKLVLKTKIKEFFSKYKSIEIVPTLSLYSAIILFYVILTAISASVQNELPKVLDSPSDNVFSAERAYSHLKYFTKTIGSRATGSYNNEVLTVNYLVSELQKLQIKSLSSNWNLEIDVQHVTGAYYEGDPLYKIVMRYTNITNVVARISNRNDAKSLQNAVLVNGHFDSVFTSEGAADDGSAISSMLELISNLISSETTSHSIVFLFNGAEEQTPGCMPGSHGFITQHPWSSKIRCFLNLDNIGFAGKQFLFNAYRASKLLKHYQDSIESPYYYGTVFAQELWKAGFLDTDTDFRIFSEYGDNYTGIPGLDFGIVNPLKHYHLSLDTLENGKKEALQLLGNNILALIKNIANGNVNSFGSADDTVFYSWQGITFLIYSNSQAVAIHSLLIIFTVVAGISYLFYRKAIFPGNSNHFWKKIPFIPSLLSIVTVLLSLIFGVIGSVLVAGIMIGMKRVYTWYSRPVLGFFLYAFPTFLGILLPQLLHRKLGATLTVDHFSLLYSVYVQALGRAGNDFDYEINLAVIVSLITFIHVLAFLPYLHKVKNMFQMIFIFFFLSIFIIIVSAPFTPYTDDAPKQVYIDHRGYVPEQKGELWIRSADSHSIKSLIKNLDEKEWTCDSQKRSCVKDVEMPIVPKANISVVTDTFDSSSNLRSITFNVSHPNTTYSTVYILNESAPIKGVSYVNNYPQNSDSSFWFWREDLIGNENPGNFWMEATGGLGAESWTFTLTLEGPKDVTRKMCFDSRYANELNTTMSKLILETWNQLPDYVMLNPWGDFVLLVHTCVEF